MIPEPVSPPNREDDSGGEEQYEYEVNLAEATAHREVAFRGRGYWTANGWRPDMLVFRRDQHISVRPRLGMVSVSVLFSWFQIYFM